MFEFLGKNKYTTKLIPVKLLGFKHSNTHILISTTLLKNKEPLHFEKSYIKQIPGIDLKLPVTMTSYDERKKKTKLL